MTKKEIIEAHDEAMVRRNNDLDQLADVCKKSTKSSEYFNKMESLIEADFVAECARLDAKFAKLKATK